jgi:drug/metabolite transporter (DMT)-like permease
VLEGQTQTSSSDLVIGIIILLIGQVFGSLNYIFEEKFLSDYDDLHPLMVVGWEGVWGSIIVTIMLIVFQFIPCSSTTLCSGNVIEDSIGAL